MMMMRKNFNAFQLKINLKYEKKGYKNKTATIKTGVSILEVFCCRIKSNNTEKIAFL